MTSTTVQIAVPQDYWSSLPSDLSHKIQLSIIVEELKEKYLSGFPPLRKDEKLNLSLDDIINPIEIGEKKAQEGGCNPGRLTLNPDAYHHAYTMTMYGENSMVEEHMRCGIGGKNNHIHRRLSRDPSQVHCEGLEDSIYFIGGSPLIYWGGGREDPDGAMGMVLSDAEVLCARRGLLHSGFQWTTLEKLQEFTLYTYLPDKCTYIKDAILQSRNTGREQLGGLIDFRKSPRTYWGNSKWCRYRIWPLPHLELNHSDDVYVRYLQMSEDR